MDTLYLVFKHHSKLSLDCLTDGIISPQANEDFNPVTSPCQATRRKTLGFLFEMQKCRPARDLLWQGDTFMCPWIPSISNSEKELYYRKTQFPNAISKPGWIPLKSARQRLVLGSVRRTFAPAGCREIMPRLMNLSHQYERRGRVTRGAKTSGIYCSH